MVIFESLSFSQGIVSHLIAWVVLVQLDRSYSSLSPVIHGDIALSINTKCK